MSRPDQRSRKRRRPVAFLLLGDDSRHGLSMGDTARLRVGPPWAGGSRPGADTIMLLVHSPATGSKLVSFPRDLMLSSNGAPVPLGMTFAIDGAAGLRTVLEEETGLPIRGRLEIGLRGFADVVDVIGGIEVDLPEPLIDPNVRIPAGRCRLDGIGALAYVRARVTRPRGDLDRIAAQQEVLLQLTRRLLTPQLLLDPARLLRVVRACVRAVTVRTDRPWQDLPSLARAVIGLLRGGNATTVPLASAPQKLPPGAVCQWHLDDRAADRLWASFTRRPVARHSGPRLRGPR